VRTLRPSSCIRQQAELAGVAASIVAVTNLAVMLVDPSLCAQSALSAGICLFVMLRSSKVIERSMRIAEMEFVVPVTAEQMCEINGFAKRSPLGARVLDTHCRSHGAVMIARVDALRALLLQIQNEKGLVPEAPMAHLHKAA